MKKIPLTSSKALKLEKMFWYELSYQLSQFLKRNNMTMNNFANQYNIPISIVIDVQNKKPVSLKMVDIICTIMGISVSILYCPPCDRDYLEMRRILIPAARKTNDFFDFAMKQYRYLNTTLPKDEYERNIAWIDFEAKENADRHTSRSNMWESLRAFFKDKSLPPHPSLGFTKPTTHKQAERASQIIKESKKKK